MMVAFLVDECFSGPLLRARRNGGFDVIRSADTEPAASDDRVLALAFEQNRIVLTEDNDFGDLTVRLQFRTHGVIRVNLKSLDRTAQMSRFLSALTELGDKCIGALVTIESTRTRIRRPDTPIAS